MIVYGRTVSRIFRVLKTAGKVLFVVVSLIGWFLFGFFAAVIYEVFQTIG
jgi:hypothetical protein